MKCFLWFLAHLNLKYKVKGHEAEGWNIRETEEVDGKKARNRQKERNNYEEIDRTFVVSAKDSCQSFFYIKNLKVHFTLQ